MYLQYLNAKLPEKEEGRQIKRKRKKEDRNRQWKRRGKERENSPENQPKSGKKDEIHGSGSTRTQNSREPAHSFPRPLPLAQPNYNGPNLKPAQKLRFCWTNPRPDPRSNRAGLQPKHLQPSPVSRGPTISLGPVAFCSPRPGPLLEPCCDPRYDATLPYDVARSVAAKCHIAAQAVPRLGSVQRLGLPPVTLRWLFSSAHLFSARFQLFRPSRICFWARLRYPRPF